MENSYQAALRRFMGVRWIAIILIALCLAATFFVGRNLQSELAPMEDRSQFRLGLTAPEGTSFDAMDKYVERLNTFMLDCYVSAANRKNKVAKRNSGHGE